MCNNQFRILSCGFQQDLTMLFEEKLRGIGKMMIVLDCWDKSVYSQRCTLFHTKMRLVTLGLDLQDLDRF